MFYFLGIRLYLEKKETEKKKNVLFRNLKFEAALLQVMFAILYKAVRETQKNPFTPTDAHQEFTKQQIQQRSNINKDDFLL